ncbi:MAG: FecR domain-containing protein, partial [Pseudomonadota bacterium]
RAAFDDWRNEDPRHADAYDRAVTLWSAYGTIEKRDLSPDLFRSRFSYWLKSRMPTELFDGLRPRARLGAAAGALSFLVVAIFSGLYLFQGLGAGLEDAAPVVASYTTEVGKFETVTLSDGSSITLGPGSDLQVAMSEEERRAELIRGAAVFSIASDAGRPFFVDAEDVSVRVVGTVFDVRNNGGVVRVSVSEGVVEAAHPFVVNDKATGMISRKALTAGQTVMASAGEGLSEISPFNPAGFAAWRASRLKYEDGTLAELIADANRYSVLPIILAEGLQDAEDVKVTFSYEGGNVERMLRALPTLFPVEIDRSDAEKIVIRRAALPPK